MDVPPPPASGLRMQELGDRLVVYFRPRRSWAAILFLGLWFLLWTVGGLAAASHLPDASPGEAAFLLFWLCGWVVGECVAVGVIAWQLFGRELLTVTSDKLEVRQAIGRFARTKRYDAVLVQDITAARVPHDEDERPRKDFCLRVSYGDQTVRIGEGMGEREAEYVASVVLSRIRVRSWWSEEDEPQLSSAPSVAPAETGGTRMWFVGGATIACVVLGGTLLVALFGRHASPAPTPKAQRSPRLPPDQRQFSNARDFAAAMTSYALTSGRTKVLERPHCAQRATWTKWACHARAKETIGPFAGRVLSYRCASVETIGGVTCSPLIDVLRSIPPPASDPNG